MGHFVECPRCQNRFRVHTGQNVAQCYRCGKYFNAHTNPPLDDKGDIEEASR